MVEKKLFKSEIIHLIYLPIKILFLFLRHNSTDIKGIPCSKLLSYGNKNKSKIRQPE